MSRKRKLLAGAKRGLVPQRGVELPRVPAAVWHRLAVEREGQADRPRRHITALVCPASMEVS